MDTRPDLPPDAPLPPHPALNAMLICDQALIEESTAKSTLVGVFETISAFQFPARHGPLCVYAKVTDAEGPYRMRLDLVRLDDLSVIGQGQFNATFGSRMASAELVFQLYGLAFAEPGRYEFRLYANDRWMGSKALNVARAPEPKPQTEQIRVFGSTVSVRWLSFMLPAPRVTGDFR